MTRALLSRALRRLVRGLGSNRAAARQGFAVALGALLGHVSCCSAQDLLQLLDGCLEVTASMKGAVSCARWACLCCCARAAPWDRKEATLLALAGGGVVCLCAAMPKRYIPCTFLHLYLHPAPSSVQTCQ